MLENLTPQQREQVLNQIGMHVMSMLPPTGQFFLLIYDDEGIEGSPRYVSNSKTEYAMEQCRRMFQHFKPPVALINQPKRTVIH